MLVVIGASGHGSLGRPDEDEVKSRENEDAWFFIDASDTVSILRWPFVCNSTMGFEVEPHPWELPSDCM